MFWYARWIFLWAKLDQYLPWRRKTYKQDPITLSQVQDENIDMGKIRCVLEYVRQDEDSLKVPGSVYRLFTGKEIKEGDVIGEEFVIKKVYKLLGVYMAYV